MMIAINYAISLYQRVKPEGWAIYVNDLQGVHQYLEKLSVHPSTKKVTGDKSAEEMMQQVQTGEFTFMKGVWYSKADCLNMMQSYATQQSQSATGAMVERINQQMEVFKWLLGYYDFPEPPETGRPRYYWRTHLRDKLKEIGIEIHNPGSPFQPRETDSQPPTDMNDTTVL